LWAERVKTIPGKLSTIKTKPRTSWLRLMDLWYIIKACLW
jgi:hypothetical protein